MGGFAENVIETEAFGGWEFGDAVEKVDAIYV